MLRIVIVLSLVATPGFVLARAKKEQNAPMMMSSAKHQFRNAMRELWTDHVVWTNKFINAAVANAPSKKAYGDRLFKNQDDIGAAVGQYYGKPAGDKLAKLLRDHIAIAAEVVSAAKAKDDKKLKDADKRWRENADQISAFLAEANPNWTKKDLLSMMNEHLDVTTKEAVAIIKSDWAKEVTLYDSVQKQIWHMADMLSEGIIKQFPERFSQSA